jgi:hypothetical protein
MVCRFNDLQLEIVSSWVGLLGMSGTLVAPTKGSRPPFVSNNKIVGIGQKTGSLEAVGSIAGRLPGELVISKRKLRQADVVQLVRLNREGATQNLGFASRPFVLCGLPIKRPAKGVLMHERRNGQFLLQVTGHPHYGVPWGQDRLVPIFLATLAMRQQKQTITFRSAAEMLDVFGMQQGGSQYRRLIAAFQRVFGATIFFGTDTQREKATVTHHARFKFMREARIWYSRDLNQATLPGALKTRLS